MEFGFSLLIITNIIDQVGHFVMEFFLGHFKGNRSQWIGGIHDFIN